MKAKEDKPLDQVANTKVDRAKRKKQVPEFYCPNGCEKVIDEEKSNENWKVQSAECPKCGERLKFRIIEEQS